MLIYYLVNRGDLLSRLFEQVLNFGQLLKLCLFRAVFKNQFKINFGVSVSGCLLRLGRLSLNLLLLDLRVAFYLNALEETGEDNPSNLDCALINVYQDYPSPTGTKSVPLPFT